MNNIVRNENDPTVDGIDVALTAPHALSFLSKLLSIPAFHSNVVFVAETNKRVFVIFFFLSLFLSFFMLLIYFEL